MSPLNPCQRKPMSCLDRGYLLGCPVPCTNFSSPIEKPRNMKAASMVNEAYFVEQ